MNDKENRGLIEDLRQLTEQLKRNPSYTRTRLDSVLEANWWWWKFLFIKVPLACLTLIVILVLIVKYSAPIAQ